MPTVFDAQSEIRPGDMFDPQPEIHLGDNTGSLAVIAPARGGIVTRFAVGGAEVLFLDPATLADPTKNVRGGIPVLFPTPGKLTDDKWAYGGFSGTLPQHGFARNRPWQVLSTLDGAVAAVSLRLAVAATADWPWSCQLDLTYTLRGPVLRIDQRVTNTDDKPMPFGIGFHPYFAVRQADKAGTRIETDATRAYDNVAKHDVDLLAPIDLTAAEVDLHLLDHHGSQAALHCGTHSVRLTGSPEYKRWVVWTVAGRDFVCLEPWTAAGNGLNIGDVLVVEPGQERALFVEIAYEGT